MTIQEIIESHWPGWRVVKELGSGAFGSVYAIAQRTLIAENWLAVKVIRIPARPEEISLLQSEGYDREQITRHFEDRVKHVGREILLMDQVKDHKNVVHIVDYAVASYPDAPQYYVLMRMELLTPLYEYLKLRPMDEAMATRLGIDLCDALTCCHENSIIHRDIKPQNIFVSDAGVFKLGDFGVSRKLEETTYGFTVTGTYNFMAPEVYNHQLRTADPAHAVRVDIYSLGMVLYTLLNNGRAPFLPTDRQPTQQERTDALLCRMSGSALSQPLNASKPLTRIILRACAPDPEARYATAADMCRDLKALRYTADLATLSDTVTHSQDARRTEWLRAETQAQQEREARTEAQIGQAERRRREEEARRRQEEEARRRREEEARLRRETEKRRRRFTRLAGIAAVAVALLAVLFVLKPWTPHVIPVPTVTPTPMPSPTPMPTPTPTPAPSPTPTPSLEEAMAAASALSGSGTLSGGYKHTVALKPDGTVIAVGYNGDHQCDVTGWKDIAAVAAGAYHTVGLRRDGTVVAVGSKAYNRCDVSDWSDIVAVSAGACHTVGLKRDGTVVAVGNTPMGQFDVSGWKDIAAVSAGYWHAVGLRRDGTVVAVGNSEKGQCDVTGWSDIAAVSAGYWHTVGLRRDGTVAAVGDNSEGQCNVSDWQDIVAVSAGYWHTVGLRRDGTVVTAGNNGYYQCNVNSWTNIVALSAGYWHTVGLRRDGTVVAVGNHAFDQCDVSRWSNIMLPPEAARASSR